MTITWCMVPKQTEFFLILDRFLPFYPLNNPKNQILKKRKKHLEVLFYISLPKIIIISYTVPEIRRVTNVIFIFHVGLFLPFYPTNDPKKSKFLKNEKKRQEILSFYICIPKIMITWCTVPEVWCATNGRTDGKNDI